MLALSIWCKSPIEWVLTWHNLNMLLYAIIVWFSLLISVKHSYSTISLDCFNFQGIASYAHIKSQSGFILSMYIVLWIYWNLPLEKVVGNSYWGAVAWSEWFEGLARVSTMEAPEFGSCCPNAGTWGHWSAISKFTVLGSVVPPT